MKCLLICLVMLFLTSETADAQFSVPSLPDIQIDIPGLDDLIESEPAITTGLDDAVYECPEMDGFEPESFTSLYDMPVCPDGSILLLPGAYEFEAKSYCLHAGSYASEAGGDGYIYAPLEGNRSEIIGALLERSSKNSEIPQTAVQSLIWAILAKCKFSDMSDYLQDTASELLTSQEIFELNGGALGLIPDDIIDDLIDDYPEPLRAALEAEARIRSVLSSAESSYEDLEEIAVFRGDPPDEYLEREIPSGRWSLHPDGYYIRYFPTGYKHTRVEIWIPEIQGEPVSFSGQMNSSYELSLQKAGLRLGKGSTVLPRKQYRGLQPFKPDGRGTAQPGNTLSQRLATAMGKDQADVDAAMQEIRQNMDTFSLMADVITFDVIGLVDTSSYLQGWMFGKALDKIISVWSDAIKALNIDPPRSDYTMYAIPSVVHIDSILPGADLSVDRAAALNSFAEVTMELLATMEAAQVSLDRMGGAFEANDSFWVEEQAICYIYYKRQSGCLMETAASRFDQLLDICESEGMEDVQVTTEMAVEYLENLEANGFDQEAVETARLLGITDAQIEIILESRLSFYPEEIQGSLFEAADACISCMSSYGSRWKRMPEVDPHWL